VLFQLSNTLLLLVLNYLAFFHPSATNDEGYTLLAEEEAQDFVQQDWTQSNFVSKLMFGWLTPLITRGNLRQLASADLFELPPEFHTEHVSAVFNREWEKEKKKRKYAVVFLSQIFWFLMQQIGFSDLPF
jgi:hypothetical protein